MIDETRLNTASQLSARLRMPHLTTRHQLKIADTMDELIAEVRRLQGVVHDCPDCGESCTQCSCHEKELERLRARTHEIQEAESRRNSTLQSECDRYRRAFKEASERLTPDGVTGVSWNDRAEAAVILLENERLRKAVKRLKELGLEGIQKGGSRDWIDEALIKAISFFALASKEEIHQAAQDAGYDVYKNGPSSREAHYATSDDIPDEQEDE